MKIANAALIATVAGSVTVASGVGTAGTGPACDIPLGIAAEYERDVRMIATAMLPLMPTEQRRAIIEAGGIGSEGFAALRDRTGEILVLHDERYEKIREAVSPALFARLQDEHLGALLASAERAANGEVPRAMCFAPGTDPELIAAFNVMFQQELWGQGGEDADPRFQIGARWTSTASSFSTGSQGTPITLTWSFAPDGAIADNLFGQNRTNQLNAWLNGIYGSQTVWQALFQDVFDQWGSVTGVTYIYEPNDDGAEANTLGGQIGVRGDVRIFAVNLDGNFNVLAYNAFPNAGDMVFDAFDSFYNNTFGVSRPLRNVAAHEHGHGLGFEHVCPQNGTKLMEPSANTNFDGIQLDEVLAGQRNYGDWLEPNDNAANATPLGSFSIGTTDSVETVSIDDNSDIDFYSFSTTQPLEIVVRVSPAAAAYLQGPQNFNGSCSSGVLTDYNTNQNLSIAIRSSNGTTTLVTVNDAPAGQTEELRFTLANPGNYYIVVDDPNTANSIQLYDMEVEGAAVPFDGPTIVAQDAIPSVVLPGTPVNLDFEVLANADTIISGPSLFFRANGGAFSSTPMTNQGGNIFRATLPAVQCDDNPEFYIGVTGDFVGQVTLPITGAVAPFAYQVGEFNPTFEDNFETATGWSDSLSTASAGAWDRGVPVASTGAPPSDFDGSGQAYVTGNAAGEDVDFGRVFLRTPALNLENGGQFNYAYWFSAGGGSFVGADSLKVEISTNGQITWTTLRTYTAPTNGWETDTIEVDAATGVAQTFFRFIAEDAGTDNIVEAAIDAVSVGQVTCDDAPPAGCNAADVAAPFGVLDLIDINAFVVGFTSQDPIADLAPPTGVFDLNDLQAFISAFTAGCP